MSLVLALVSKSLTLELIPRDRKVQQMLCAKVHAVSVIRSCWGLDVDTPRPM